MKRTSLAMLVATSLTATPPMAVAQTATDVPSQMQQSAGSTDGSGTDGDDADAIQRQETATTEIAEGQLRSLLQALGMENIREFERDGDHYVTIATWLGEDVELRIEARTGKVVEPVYLTENQIAYRLKRLQGFENVSLVERDGEFNVMAAERDGFRFQLKVDARTGDVVEMKAR